MLTGSRLEELLTYNPDTGVFRWSRIPRKGVRSGEHAGCVGDGCVTICIDRIQYKAHRLAWLWMYGRWPERQIDHINGDPRDNRLANLREATPHQNMGNAKRRADNGSGFKGVARNASGAAGWRAYLGGKHIGCFPTREEAHAAYLVKAREVFGEFAHDGKRALMLPIPKTRKE